MLSDKLISVIVRTRNEERWITRCLSAIFEQKHNNFEVIIVDNESSDNTIERARQYPIKKIIICKDYRPGKALNMGIRESAGDYIVSLAGHCIPVNDQWLIKLLVNFEDNTVAGVYGRQEALGFTSDFDKRDMALVFGLDRKVQVRDSFFHNANSMIRRDIWQQIPFDEEMTNIEDRGWAQNVLQRGFKIIYEPQASVYHHHGIYQKGDTKRCTNIVRILESLHSDYTYKSIDARNLNIVALIPIKGPVQYLNNQPLLSYTLRRVFESKYIKKTIVSTDNIELANLAKGLGAEAPFIRDPSFSGESIDLAKVYQHSLNKIEELKIFPDIIVCLEVTFPFRPQGFIDDMILKLTQDGFDSVIAAKTENKAIWQEKEGCIEQIVEGLTPRKFKDSVFIELKGLACVTHPEFLRQGSLLGGKIGIYEVDNPYSCLEVRDDVGFKLASRLVDGYFSSE